MPEGAHKKHRSPALRSDRREIENRKKGVKNPVSLFYFLLLLRGEIGKFIIGGRNSFAIFFLSIFTHIRLSFAFEI